MNKRAYDVMFQTLGESLTEKEAFDLGGAWHALKSSVGNLVGGAARSSVKGMGSGVSAGEHAAGIAASRAAQQAKAMDRGSHAAKAMALQDAARRKAQVVNQMGGVPALPSRMGASNLRSRPVDHETLLRQQGLI